ncbi:MAG TPA: hypothetical protein VM491_10865 [Burkholderiaceae bacterium]|jgi:hypothetical protein|nr:hypothetical protein [Burkholderiaceae bacterium]
MTQTQGASKSADDLVVQPQERVPMMQQLLDNPFALLFLGITVPTVFYIVWGVMEILSVPISPLAK